MVKVKKRHRTLKIVLCCILAVIVILGGTAGIWALYSVLNPTAGVEEPDERESTRKELPAGATYSTLSASGTVSGLDNLAYMAYVLDNQTAYSVYAFNTTESGIYTQYTRTYKDYKNIDGVGYMVVSDLTYSSSSVININSGTQSLFVVGDTDGAGVYMRTTGDTINSNSVYTEVEWSTDEPTYYDDSLKTDEENGYYYNYGMYSTEMTVYIFNEETVASYSDVTDNGDGTYTQTYTLNESAAYWYQYAMYTHGGLSSMPEFDSISVTITFDDNYQVLEIVTEEEGTITKSAFNMSTSATTTTTFTYGDEAVNEDHFAYCDSYYAQYVGTLSQSSDNPVTSVEYTDVLLSVFSGALTGGQQFDVTLNVGEDTVLYGRLYISVDISDLSLESVNVRLALSADSDIDSQDFYIELFEGTINCYYSTDFALTVSIADITDIVNSFTEFVSSFETGSAVVLSETSEDEGLTLDGDYEDGILTLTVGYSGISLDLVAEITEDSGVYTLVSGSLSVSYNGTDLGVSLGLEPSSADTISYDAAESPFDLAKGVDSLLKLINSENLAIDITLEGSRLSTFLAALGVDLDVSDLVLDISGNVNTEELTVSAGITLTSVSSGTTYLDATVYYVYNGSSSQYGTAYVNIATLLGEEINLKVSCEIDDLVNAVSTILSAVQSSEAVTLSDTQADGISSVITAVFSLDFSGIIGDLTANGSVIGATINLDSLFAQLGVNIGLGDIALSYTIGEDGVGSLYASVEGLGLAVSISGGDEIELPNASEYVDIGFIVDFVESGITTDEEGNTSVMYTFYQEELSLSLLSMITININKVYVTVGFDEEGEFLLSLTGELQDSTLWSAYTLATASTIGFTYYNGYITLVRGSEYRVMTADYLVDNILTYDSSSYEALYAGNILTWYLGMSGTTWAVIAAMASDVLNLSSGLLDVDDVYLYDVADDDEYDVADDESTALSLADYLLGYIFSVDGTTLGSYGDMSTALANLGLTDSTDTYYAISLYASAISSMFETLDIAIMGDSETGIGGLKAYLSIGGMISTLIDLDYSTEYTAVTNYYKYAVETYGIDFDYDFSDVELETGHVAIFGEYNSADNEYVYSETLEEYTLYIYSGDELIGTQTVRYGAIVYLYDISYLVTIDGVDYIYVCYDADGNVVAGTDGLPVTSLTVSEDVYVYLVPAEECGVVSVSITVHDNLSGDDYEFTVYAGTTLEELIAEEFDGYAVDGGWTIGGAVYDSSDYTITADDDNTTLYVTLARSTVTINGVVYTFYAAGSSDASNNSDISHYEISGHTSEIETYFSSDTVLVLESEIDGYKVTAIRADALKNDINTTGGLQNVIVSANITYVGTNAFTDNYGMQTAIFLADEVTLAGSTSGKTYPFYGCSTSNGGSTSSLTVYYNIISSNDTTYNSDYSSSSESGNLLKSTTDRWNHFRRSGSSISYTDYYFAAYGADSWYYIDLSAMATENDCDIDELFERVTEYLSENSYTYNEAIYKATGCMLITAVEA